MLHVTALAMRLQVSLLDAGTWKFLPSSPPASVPGDTLPSDASVTIARARQQALQLVADTATGGTGIYPAVRSLIVTLCTVPEGDAWRSGGAAGAGTSGGGASGGKGGALGGRGPMGGLTGEQFLLLAAAVTAALRPIIVFGKMKGEGEGGESEVLGKPPAGERG